MANHDDDRWLLPSRQADYPGRELLPEATLHRRRELTFFVLAATYVFVTSMFVLVGSSRVIDLDALLVRVAPTVDVRVAALMPLAAVPFALSFVALAMIGALFGRTRASVVVGSGVVATAAIVGLMRAADLIDGGATFRDTLPMAACAVVAHVTHLLVFAVVRTRRLLLRTTLAAALANAAGWAVLALVLGRDQTANALAIGGGAATFACTFVLALPAVLITSALAIALRVYDEPAAEHDHARDYEAYDERPHVDRGLPRLARASSQPAPLAEGSVSRRLPAAHIVDDADADADEVVELRRKRAASVPPYSSAEMRFFSEGDEERA